MPSPAPSPAAVSRVALSALPTVSRVGAGLGLGIGALHLLVLPAPLRGPLALHAAAAGLVAAAACAAARRWPALGRSGGGALVTGVLLANQTLSVHHLVATGEPWQVTNLMLGLVAGGVVALEARHLAAVSALAWAGFGIAAGLRPGDPLWVHFALAMVFTQVLAIGLHRVLRGWLGQAEQARRGEARQRAQVEEQAAGMQAAWARADEASRMKDALLFALERELRGPLACVAALPVDDLGAGAPPHARDQLRGLQRQGARTLERLDQLLAFSGAAKGPLPVDRAPVQAEELLESLLLQLSPEVAPGVRLSWGLEGDPPPRAALDLRQLQLAWRALLRNALEHTARGAVHAVLRARTLPRGADGGARVEVELEVLDTGVGLPPGDPEQLFVPLRLAAGEAGARPSVGLALARQIAGAMGGGAEARRRPEGGAAARIWVQGAVVEAAAPPRTAAGWPVRVEVADPVWAEGLRRRLARLGHGEGLGAGGALPMGDGPGPLQLGVGLLAHPITDAALQHAVRRAAATAGLGAAAGLVIEPDPLVRLRLVTALERVGLVAVGLGELPPLRALRAAPPALALVGAGHPEARALCAELQAVGAGEVWAVAVDAAAAAAWTAAGGPPLLVGLPDPESLRAALAPRRAWAG